MNAQADRKPVLPAGAPRCAPLQRRSPSAWAYARGAAVLATGLALTMGVFLYAQSLERRSVLRDGDVRLRCAPAANALLLGGGVITLYAAVCCGPLLARFARRERRQAKDTARASEEALSQILHGTSIPLFVIDHRHVVTRWNQACENLTRVPAQEIMGTVKPWSAFYAAPRPVLADFVVDQRPREEIAALYGANCRESTTLPGAYEIEAFFPNFGEGGKWLFFTAAPLRDTAGRVVGAIETFQDITERKRAEEELQKLASVVRHTSELISLATPDGQMIFLNEAGSRMLGIDPADVAQTHVAQILPDHLQAKLRTEILPALARQGVWEGDLEYRHLKTGALTAVHAMVFTITDPGAGVPLYLANVSLDMTERKRVESELQRRIAELSEAKRRMEVLVSNTTDREKRMVDLKREVNDLLQTLGCAPKYEVPRKVAELSGACPSSVTE